MTRTSDFSLPKFEDIFSTQEERDEAKLDKIRDIPLSEIDPFPDHPFHVRDDEDMLQLVESIKEHGVMTPAVLRLKEDGRYELVAGHRRKRACELAGLDTLRSEVKDLTRDEAVVYMVESNFQRTAILPSEKAFAYRMRYEAMKRQAGRPAKGNSSPVGTDFRSDELLSQETGDSRNQIHRYIRLTYLIPELLKLVDEGRMKMRPAVELSYLNPYYQQFVLDEIELNECTPSHAQTIRMRKLADEHALDADIISDIMSEEKPNQKTERLAFNAARVRKLLPDDLPKEKTEDFICEAITFYRKYYRERSARSSDRDAR